MFGSGIDYEYCHVNSKSLISQLIKIKEAFLKPVVDLRDFPAIDVAGFHKKPCSSLKGLKTDLNLLREHLNEPSVFMKDKENRVPALLSEIESIIAQIETYGASVAPSPKNKKIKMKKLDPMRNLVPILLPTEVWTGIFSTLSYQDKLSFGHVCKTFREIMIGDETNLVSSYTLLRCRGFFSRSAYKVASVISAYQKATSDAYLFRKDDKKFEKKFRASFQQTLIDDKSAIKLK